MIFTAVHLASPFCANSSENLESKIALLFEHQTDACNLHNLTQCYYDIKKLLRSRLVVVKILLSKLTAMCMF